MKTMLGVSSNGIPVYDATDIGGHVHAGVMPIINEVISKVELINSFVRITVDMGRVIGKDHLVRTGEYDDIVFYRRGNRLGETRFTMNRDAEDTSKVTIILCVATEGEFHGEWVVVTAFEGLQGERQPWDASLKTDEQKEIARIFWDTHALVPTAEERAEIDSATLW